MALTFRSNGVAGGLVSATWWNDYYNLLTGVMTDQPVTIGNSLTLTTFNSAITLKDGGGTTRFSVDNSGNVTVGGMIPFPFTTGQVGTSNWFKFDRLAGSSYCHMEAGGSAGGFGFIINGVKRAELRNNGNFMITGTYQTALGSFTTQAGQSFDTFDVAEVFQCDAEYPNGTIVCPGPNDQLTQCAHDNCYTPMVVSYQPGMGLGVNDHAAGVHYVALAGRVNVRTAQDIGPRQMVCSDGRGGVRTLKAGEASAVVGFTLNSTSVIDGHSVVGVFLRPQFVTLRG